MTTSPWSNHTLQRTRPSRLGCNSRVPWPGSLSLGRCKVENPTDSGRSAVVFQLLVDSRSAFTWIAATTLRAIGIQPVKHDLQIQMANGRIIKRSVGFGILRVGDWQTIDEILFARPNDVLRLGFRALTGMNLRVDARRNKLVLAGPIIAATASAAHQPA